MLSKKLFFFLFAAFSPCFLLAELGYVEPWGKDAPLKIEKQSPPPFQRKLSPMALLAQQVILFHHHVVTHIDDARSHYRPSSSTYMLEAIRKYGFIKGYIMGCDRLLRENSDPWVYRTRVMEDKIFKWDPPR